MSKLKKTLSMALCAVLSVFAAVIFAAGAGKTTAYAASPIGGEDGRGRENRRQILLFVYAAFFFDGKFIA